MAIVKKSEDTVKGSLTVEVNNGDLEALTKIINEWDFKDVESALRYAVAVLSIAKDKKLSYEREDGKKITIEPADSLRREKSNGQKTE